ncbi:MAG: hypothetical protein R6V58_17665 [Planctomycetota bacterium]
MKWSRELVRARIARGLVVAVAVMAVVGLAGCVRPPKRRDMPAPETTLGVIGESTWHYGAIDDYFETGGAGTIAQGLLVYPADWVLDVGVRLPKAIVYDLPVAAWEGTFGTGEPEEAALGRYTPVAAPVLLPANYARAYFGGLWEQIRNRPIESGMHVFSGWLFYEIVVQRGGTGGQGCPPNGNNGYPYE